MPPATQAHVNPMLNQRMRPRERPAATVVGTARAVPLAVLSRPTPLSRGVTYARFRPTDGHPAPKDVRAEKGGDGVAPAGGGRVVRAQQRPSVPTGRLRQRE